ncbi:MAG: ribosome biogenesis GTPase Der [Anaerolineales bacterium]|nr:ribosome biogenesis GTPase Der [Anaerolineales bacterium]
MAKRVPVVALVGRPNVGKSTLFNRLAGERLAVVDDTPGTTRDRLHVRAEWTGVEFIVVDTGGIDPTTIKVGDGREPLSIGSRDFIKEIRVQAEIAIQDANAVLLLVDVESGITPADEEVAKILRRNQKEINGELYPPVLLVVNKCDNNTRLADSIEFYSMGLGEIYPISAMHGRGTGDLLDALVSALKVSAEDFTDQEEDDDSVKIAIVGKPNAGKSSLLNKLIGQERAIVSPIAGTTRDAVDEYLTYDGIPITLIDTAGIRRRGKVEPGVEKYSVLRAMQAIERADVALLVVDAITGITKQDAHIAGFILEAWKSVVVVVNKWDAIEKDTYTMDEYTKHVRAALNFLDYVPILFISALSGQRVHQVLPTALQVQEERLVRLSTAEINRVLHRAMDHHPPPTKAGRPLKIFYGTQVRSDPPTFLIFVNDHELVHFTYKRYLENRFREVYSFLGTPIRLVFKSRKKVELDRR